MDQTNSRGPFPSKPPNDWQLNPYPLQIFFFFYLIDNPADLTDLLDHHLVETLALPWLLFHLC